MLVGVVAFNVLRVMDPSDTRALGVLLTGYFFQGMFRIVLNVRVANDSSITRSGILYDILLSLYLRHSVCTLHSSFSNYTDMLILGS